VSYRIREAGPDEVDDLHEILRRCGRDIKLRFGLSHWDPPYPLRLLRRDAAERRVCRVLGVDRTVATFTLDTEPFSYYDMTIWEAPGSEAIYVSRLAVDPDLQGHGIGTWCMEAIERLAAGEGREAVRLDAHGRHEKLVGFYAGLGYAQRGIATFRGAELVCLEKMITG
jgi:GNAT superfamily N-acetyltransferase